MSDETPKLRLRPKLTEGTPPVASTPAPDPAIAPVGAEPGAAPAAASETKTIRLKPRAPVAPAPVVSGAPASAPIVAPPVPPPAAPVAPVAPPAAAAIGPEAASAPLESPEADEATVPLAPLAERAKAVQRTAIIIAAAGVIVFAGVAAIAFPRLIAQQTEQNAAAQRLEKLIRDAKDDTGEAALADKPAAPAVPASVAQPPAAPPAALPPSAAPPAPAPAPPPAAVAVAPVAVTPGEPSDAFRTWVMNLKITGVRSGNNPRILVGGAAFAVGDTVNADLGIRFDGYDAGRGMLRFKDMSGAFVERRQR